MGRDFNQTVYTNLFEALGQPGCALCRLVLVSLTRYFDHLTFEFVNDLSIRDAIRSSWGFCAAHGEMLRAKQDALGTAIIYRDVLQDVASQFRSYGKSDPSGFLSRFLGKKPDSSPARDAVCPACVLAGETEASYLTLLLERFSDDALCHAFSLSSGLCVPHIERGLEISKGTLPQDFQRRQIEIWERLTSHLAEFIRKSDHRFRDEPMGEESDSWQRAVPLVSGDARCQPRQAFKSSRDSS